MTLCIVVGIYKEMDTHIPNRTGALQGTLVVPDPRSTTLAQDMMTSTKMTIKDDVAGGAGNHFLRIWKEPETTFDFLPIHVLSIPYNNPTEVSFCRGGY